MEEKIAGFVRTIRGRNIRESVVAVLLAGWFGYALLGEPSTALETAGRVVLLLACLLILVVAWGRLHIPTSELVTYPPAEHADRWRAHLTTQARWLRFAWLWYVLPLFAGIALVMLGRGGEWTAVRTVSALIAAALAIGIGLLNFQAARQLERDRDTWLGTGNPAEPGAVPDRRGV
jgi:hypothetical protein